MLFSILIVLITKIIIKNENRIFSFFEKEKKARCNSDFFGNLKLRIDLYKFFIKTSLKIFRFFKI